MVAHTYNLSTQEAEAGGLKVPSQPKLHSKDLSQKSEKKNRWGKQLNIMVFQKYSGQ
jgi:hypothetical protein